jgi:cysteine-rich repeat protein
MAALLLTAPSPIAAQPMSCDAEPPGGVARPLWQELAPPDGSGYPDYQTVSSNLKLLDSLALLASLATRAAEKLHDLTSEVEDPEADGRCVCCVSTNCTIPEVHFDVKRKDCTAAMQCTALEGPDYPIWLPTDLFKDPNKAARFALEYLEFLDDIRNELSEVETALQALGNGIEDIQGLIAMYLDYIDTFTEGFHLGGYSIERPNLHLCVGYGGHGAFAEMLDLFGEVSIGGRYTSHNLSREHRAQFRAGGFGVTAFGRAISILPGIEADVQLDGFKLWDANRPFGIDVGAEGDLTCADGAGFRITDIDAVDLFHLIDSSTDLTPFDTSGDGCLQPGEMVIVDFYEARYRSAADGLLHDWPRPTFPYDWEKQNTAVFSAGLNLPLALKPIEKLIPPTGIVLFPGATLYPKLTLKAGTEWSHQVNRLRARLQDAINTNLSPAAQLDEGDFERPMHALQAPDVSEDNGSSAYVQPRIAADLVLGIALSRYLTLGITASVGTSVRVEPAAHGGVHDLNVALAQTLLNSNPPPSLPCDPIIAVTESTICSNGLHQSFDPEASPMLMPLSDGTYSCDIDEVTSYHCKEPEQEKECEPGSAGEDCPETMECVAEYGCVAHGYCTRILDAGPDGKEGADDDVVSVEHDTTYQACIGEAVCDDAATNAGAACDEDADCFGPIQCVGGTRPGTMCMGDDDCPEGDCTAPTAPCVQFSPVGYFTPYQCLVRDEPAITGWQGPGCHPLSFGFPSACGCAGDADCVAGQETCVDGLCDAQGSVPCVCDPADPSPCTAGRVCVEGACVLDCSANGVADCAAHQTCVNGGCANSYGIPFAEQIVWQTTHTQKPQHAVASYALSDILTSAILDAGLRIGLDLRIFKKLYHFDVLDLRDYWTLLAFNKSWYQAGLEARYQNDCDPVAGDTVSNWQPGAQRVKRYNPFGVGNAAYGNAGTVTDLQQWCMVELPNDVADPPPPDDDDLTAAATDLLDWGEDIGADVWALGGLCVAYQAGDTTTQTSLGEWLADLDSNAAAVGCSYTFNNQTLAPVPCSTLPNHLLLVWGCLDTGANPFAPPLATIPGIVTTFNNQAVFDLPAMLIDPAAEFTLDNLKPNIRSVALNAGVFWYQAVTQCFAQHHGAVQPGDVQIGGIQIGPCCGNGTLDNGGCRHGEGVPPCESCDDGNTAPGDGCSPLCRTEGRPRPLGACGNGIVEHQDLEQCDDGNLDPGDGCEADCTLTVAPASPSATATASGVARPTATATRVAPSTATARATRTFTRRPCPGDCNGSDAVGIEELITGVRIALAATPLSACQALDTGNDGRVTIDDLVRAVRAALNGC